MIVRWTKGALSDLDGFQAFYNRLDPRFVARAVREVRRAVERLREFPNSGRPGRIAETREAVVANAPLAVVYRVEAGGPAGALTILAVLHWSRQWPPEG